HRQRGFGRLLIMFVGLFRDAWQSAQCAEPGSKAHEPRTERVYGSNSQPCWIFEQVPLLLGVAGHGTLSQAPAGLLVRLWRHWPLAGLELGQHSRVHFGGSLARKRYCQNFFGPLDCCQQSKNAISEEFGFSGTRRCLNEK